MTPCAAALVLLLDASGSILPADWALQVGAHASAFEAETITRVIEREPVAVTAFAFSDAPTRMVAWRLLASAADSHAFAAALRAAPRGPIAGTSIASAIQAATGALANPPCRADVLVMDLVTDGEAAPEPVQAARDEAAALGIRINAIGVGAPSAAEWLRENAITADGFAMQAEGWADVARAVRRKIAIEVAGR